MSDRRPAPENADSGIQSTLARAVLFPLAYALRAFGLPRRCDESVAEGTLTIERTPDRLEGTPFPSQVAELADRGGVQRSNPEETTSIRWFSLLRLLGDRRRRLALHYLARHDSRPVKLEDLARYVAARERGIDVGEVPEDAYEDAFVELARTHLPLLATTGVVEYERIGLMVGLADVPWPLTALLQAAARYDPGGSA
ncbi:DUF7344 domain-containing protein [Halomicrococcus gelatinilyticus]|uniref:DUF7344 domain-containing protein n=1 Tax=Halomicrococcus gelatinilyticus TaxID=1702103 RepID=UPI002E132BA0